MKKKRGRKPALYRYKGRELTMTELARETAVPMMTLYQRWHRGMRGADLVRPARRYRLSVNGSSAHE